MNKECKQKLNKMVTAEIKRIMGTGFDVELREIRKNNGVLLHAVNIREKGKELAPLFYLEKYEKDYMDGKNAVEIAKDICSQYIERMHEKQIQFDVKAIMKFEDVKAKISYKLINAEKNKKNLRNAPYRSFLDLAIVYLINLDIEDAENPTVMVNNLIMRNWGVTEEELYQIARENADNLLDCQIRSMREVIMSLAGVEAEKSEDKPEKDDLTQTPEPMYVLTNRRNINGAVCMLNEQTLEVFAREHDCDFYIVPSSVHEVLLLPDTGGIDAETLKTMVMEVNTTQVAPEEVLSDNVYYYSREEADIRICK